MERIPQPAVGHNTGSGGPVHTCHRVLPPGDAAPRYVRRAFAYAQGDRVVLAVLVGFALAVEILFWWTR